MNPPTPLYKPLNKGLHSTDTAKGYVRVKKSQPIKMKGGVEKKIAHLVHHLLQVVFLTFQLTIPHTPLNFS